MLTLNAVQLAAIIRICQFARRIFRASLVAKTGLLLASLVLAVLWLWPSSAYGDDPTFSVKREFGIDWSNTRSIAVGDVDGDGDLDLVEGGHHDTNEIYLNDGTGNFPTQRGHGCSPSYGWTWSVALADVDGDGDLDLVTGDFGRENYVCLNDGAGNFSIHQVFGTGSDDTMSVAVGDMDGDGDLDIVAGNDGPNAVYLNDGTGSDDTPPPPPTPTPIPPPPWPSRDFGTGSDGTTSVAVGDLDGDGDLDIIAGNNGPNAVYLNDGAGNFPTNRDFGTGSDDTRSVAVGDLDGDGDLDLIAGNVGQIAVYLNDGAGNFPSSSARNFGLGFTGAVGDVDGDGDLDIVGDVVYLNDGAGYFQDSVDFGDGPRRRLGFDCRQYRTERCLSERRSGLFPDQSTF